MTEKIYYEDVYCREFEAEVKSCTENKKQFQIILNRTAFYPEGGGQPGDKGVLFFQQETDGKAEQKAANISDTHEKEGEIIHYADSPIPAGTKVQGRIDWQFRFDMMQNHSGEHIVSGLIHQKYGYENVGFHMGSDFITIDLSGELNFEQIREIEQKANQVVWENSATDIQVYDEESVKKIEYRSKKELHGEVRIVTFPGADVCACCGTHVTRTGEIGLIRIYSAQRFRGGVRMELLCGRRALEYDQKINDQNHVVSVALSAKPLETGASVEKLKKQAGDSSYRLMELELRLDEQLAADLTGAGDIVLFAENASPDSIRRTCVKIMDTCGGICAVFGGNDADGYKYAVGQTGGDIRSLIQEMNRMLAGRGGGRPFFAQGSVSAARQEICAWAKTRGWTVQEKQI